ncbi:ParB family protein [uncultured Pseudoalteromonas sp.]|uniref:ParB family protein n=1 Tax=uncultured Pseudoalteromonas sp. TaxID=114053 RepID=UPI00259524CC|nr:ParB family protein [uncultured Pseudoalteromonas sp.]
MARKKGTNHPISSAYGSEEAIRKANLVQVDALAGELKSAISKTGVNLATILKDTFGVSSVSESTTWTLKSGKEVTLTPVTLSYEQVLNDTYVRFEINGRDQASLTAESLSDLDSICVQQYYPAIGHYIDNKIDVLDGSRRRARFLLEKGAIKTFQMLVASDEISAADAKALAKELQTAKEHNLREVGMRLQLMKDALQAKTSEPIKQVDLAKAMGMSQTRVSNALTAASVSPRIIQLFPDVSLLAVAEYKLLSKIQTELEESERFEGFIDAVEIKALELEGSLSSDESKAAILAIIKDENQSNASGKKEKAVTTKLLEFDSKKQYANKTVQDRKTTFTFNRVSKDKLQEVEEAILKIFSEHN